MRVRVVVLPLIVIFKLCNDKNEGRGGDLEQKDDSTGNLTLAVLGALAVVAAGAFLAALVILRALAVITTLALLAALAVVATLAVLAALAFLRTFAMITTLAVLTALALLHAFAMITTLTLLRALTLHRTIGTTHSQNKSNSK